MSDWPSATAAQATMRAVVFREFGPPDVLRVESTPTPAPGPGELLVRVAAVSIGRLLDVVARAGHHPWARFEFPHILGAEHSGVVVGAGAGGHSFEIGDRVAVFPTIRSSEHSADTGSFGELDLDATVIGTHRPGAYAEYTVVPAANAHQVPAGVSAAEAAAVALAGTVALTQFVRVGGVGAGTRVLVPGASSALGCTTALLARHLGADVVVTSRDLRKRAQLTSHGFDHVLDSTAPDYPAQVMAAFAGRGPDVIVDNLGDATLWLQHLEILAPGGAVVSSGALLGAEMSIDLRRLYRLSQRIIGVRSGSLEEFHQLWTLVEGGFRPVIDQVFPLDEAASAHERVENDENVGRILLAPWSPRPPVPLSAPTLEVLP